MTNEIKESILIVRAIKSENINSERTVSQCERIEKLLNPESNDIKKSNLTVRLIVLYSLIIGVIWSLFVYGCISFFNLGINPFKWSQDSRLFMVLMGFFMSLIISVFGFLANINRKK